MLRAFAISLPVILAGDFLWLGFVMKGFNLRQLAGIGRIEGGSFQLQLLPSALAYLLMALSIALFAAPRASAASSGLEAFAWGAALGLVVYGIYDCTNLAILRDYPWAFAGADVAWGTFLYGFVTWVAAWVLKGWLA